MKVQCKKCSPKLEIEIPDFSQSEKQKIFTLRIQSTLQAMKYLIDNFSINDFQAKYILLHTNKTYGLCKRCVFDRLDKEYITCPKCGALNFNWKIEMENKG